MTEYQSGETEFTEFMRESKRIYEEAVRSLPNPEPPDEYKGTSLYLMQTDTSDTFVPSDCPSLQEQLIHHTFLEELVFWTIKFEFPQKMVCLLLKMLEDIDYKVIDIKTHSLFYP
jgi:E3 ubiquitin-protein ligase UBR3